jgi:ectoine hydroxylase-related dioxygenase (phytanoyl-CoA dioxygenase family)
MLSQAQIEFYHENGYLGVENVLSPAEVAELQRVTDEFVEMSHQVTQHTDVFDLEPGHTPEKPRLRRLKDPIKQHPVYDQALRHQSILDIVEQLIGPGIRTNGNKLNMKSAGFGSAVEWHQDIAFYPHTNDDILAVGIAIDDMMMENGPLMIIPGSHKGPIYSHHQDGGFVGAVTGAEFELAQAVPIELRAGGISIHHARALHASAPNVSNRPRRLLLFQYCSADSWPLLGIDWAGYAASFLRGSPVNRPRLADIPVYLPLPKGEKEGSIYEIQTMLKDKVMAKQAVR